MKLLLYSHFFAPSVGGVESLVLSLARGLAEEKISEGISEFDITLVTQIAANGYDDSLLPFRVVRQPHFLELLELVRASDLVHVAGASFLPLVFARLAGKPVVVEHHGFQTICPTGQLLIEPGGVPCPGHFEAGRHLECLRCRSDNNWLKSFRLWAATFPRRYLCGLAAANVMPTEWLGKLLHLPNSVSIPHGIEARSFGSGPLQPTEPPRIIFQGRLVSTKGLPLLLEAARILRLKERLFEILVIGDGPERTNIQELAARMELGSFVQFVGSVPARDLDEMFATAAVVVVPSLGGEVFGLVLAETMCRGLPIVASDLGSFREVLGDAGLTFEVGNAQALAEQIARLLDDRPFASALGLHAKDRIVKNNLRESYDKEACRDLSTIECSEEIMKERL